jgi:hypothetical protein
VFAPIPSANVTMTMIENDGRFASDRVANFRSCRSVSILFLRRVVRVWRDEGGRRSTYPSAIESA